MGEPWFPPRCHSATSARGGALYRQPKRCSDVQSFVRILVAAPLAAAAALVLIRGVVPAPRPERPAAIEVVVDLLPPSAARVALAAPQGDSTCGRATLAAEQRRFVRGRSPIPRCPGRETRWRYRLVANGFAVVLPESAIPALRTLHGVGPSAASTAYAAPLDRSPHAIGAPQLWGAGLADRGTGREDRDHRRRHRPPPSVLLPRAATRCRPGFPRVRRPTRPRR